MGIENVTVLSEVPKTNRVNATFSWVLGVHRWNDLEVVKLASRTPGSSVLHSRRARRVFRFPGSPIPYLS
jgi:hypothetical protein